MVFYMDGVIGEMVAAIQAKEGMWENTIWVHQSDNGGPSAKSVSGSAGNNWPLRGGKHTARGLAEKHLD